MKRMINSRMAALAVISFHAIMSPTPARADAVVDWNIITGQTIPFAARPGGAPALDYAMVNAAIHDAVQAYDRRFEPYAVEITGASGSPVAAPGAGTGSRQEAIRAWRP